MALSLIACKAGSARRPQMTRRSQQARRDGYRATRREYFFGGASAISFFGVGQVEQIFLAPRIQSRWARPQPDRNLVCALPVSSARRLSASVSARPSSDRYRTRLDGRPPVCALLVSSGGTIAGAAFVSGRGGSLGTLLLPSRSPWLASGKDGVVASRSREALVTSVTRRLSPAISV